jgi:hypothetical protein
LQLCTWNKPCLWVFSVVAILYLQFMVHIMLFPKLNVFRSLPKIAKSDHQLCHVFLAQKLTVHTSDTLAMH